MVVLCLLLLLGGALTSCSPIPSNLTKAHESIVRRLSLTEVGSDPLFNNVIRSLNTSCQEDVKVLNATLDVYMRIFENFQFHKEVPVSDLEVLKSYISTLKSRLSNLQKKEDLISKINTIKVDDSLVQRKALAELKEVYLAAKGFLHY